MNYIKKLETQLDAKNEQLQTVFDKTTDMLRYLSSEKFHGHENNYVSADEARRLIIELRFLIVAI